MACDEDAVLRRGALREREEAAQRVYLAVVYRVLDAVVAARRDYGAVLRAQHEAAEYVVAALDHALRQRQQRAAYRAQDFLYLFSFGQFLSLPVFSDNAQKPLFGGYSCSYVEIIYLS